MKHGQGHWKKTGSDDANQYTGQYKQDMKHGYGEFEWGTGSAYKGRYVNDKKKGYGEMHWSDGSIYRGFWANGVQDALGMMIFKDGMRKAGFFEENIYLSPLRTMEEFQKWEVESKASVPEAFRQEIKEYLGQLQELDDTYADFIGQKLIEPEMEDLMATNALKNMQDMANSPWLQNGMSMEEYAKGLQEIEEAAKKHDNDPEPDALVLSKSQTHSKEIDVKLPEIYQT